jgi:hypothetical protein
MVLKTAPDESLLEHLARMQAMVLYQILWLSNSNIQQHAAAEQQKSLVGTWGLKLLQRANLELKDAQSKREDWILLESIRRTVMVTFMLHGVYSILHYGVCLELLTSAVLPVSPTATRGY